MSTHPPPRKCPARSISELSARRPPSRTSSTGRRTPSRSMSTGSRRAPSRSSSKRSDGDAVTRLQTQLNEAMVKHKEEIYWLQLELNTTRKAKSAVEDRLTDMYRDLQTLQDDNSRGRHVRQRPVILTAEYVTGVHAQLDKYERMFRISNNQISIVRSSSDNMVKGLKDEISDLMNEKCKMETELMNKLSDLESENRRLKEKQVRQLPTPAAAQAPVLTPSPKLAPAVVIQASSDTTSTETRSDPTVQQELDRLKEDNMRLSRELEEERCNAKENHINWKRERATLSTQIDSLETDLLALTSSSGGMDQVLAQRNREKDDIIQTLDRVSLLWDRTDESIHNLEHVMAELQPHGGGRDTHEENPRQRDQRDHLLSTMETASLVHGQVKVSLMLIELRLRNNLACIKNDDVQLGFESEMASVYKDRVQEVQQQAMAAIAEIERNVETQVQQLSQQAEREAQMVKDALENKVKDLSRMQSRQAELESEIAQLQTNRSLSQDGRSATSGEEEVFVSRVVLEKLQNEVLQVVERVQEKNEEIGRLSTTLEEHKVRERTLMEELKRHMKEQGERQLKEQQRLLEQARLQESSDDEYLSEDYEEIVEEETIYEEIVEEETVYEEA